MSSSDDNTEQVVASSSEDEEEESSWSKSLSESDLHDPDDDRNAAHCPRCRKRKCRAYPRGREEWHFCSQHGDYVSIVQYYEPIKVTERTTIIDVTKTKRPSLGEDSVSSKKPKL